MAKKDFKVKNKIAKEKVIKSRQYTVGYLLNNGRPNPSPKLTISGKWLVELGFTIGSSITLTSKTGQLIIRLTEETDHSLLDPNIV